ncbi:MAG: putative signal transducing protein [Halanaerobiales bacterium]
MNESNYVLLGNFASLEAEVIESILRELDIPVLRQYPDSGGYMKIYAGMSQTGVSLYVPEAELDRARQAIEN